MESVAGFLSKFTLTHLLSLKWLNIKMMRTLTRLARVCDEDEMKGESGDKTAPDVDAVGNNEPAAVAQVAGRSAIHGNNSAEAKAMQDAIAKHMAKVHAMVQSRSQYFLKTQRRYNYVTPKSFLSFIEFIRTCYRKSARRTRNSLKPLCMVCSALKVLSTTLIG